MKARVTILIVFSTLNVFSQNRSNIWELCYFNTDPYPLCELRYQNGIMDTVSVFRKSSFFITNTSICDTNGNLLFYTNGIIIENKNYDTLLNSENFNAGWATDENQYDGLSACQAVLIIPDPKPSSRYFLFHITGEEFVANNQYEVQPLHLSYTIIDMNLDNGLGGVVDEFKNVHLIEDTLTWGGLTAVRHANGIDWWIIAHRYYSEKYYKFLLTENGIEGPIIQHIGSEIKYDVDVQATFSPDGSKFCFSNHGGWFDYMEFNRCTGEFSNSLTVVIPDSLAIYGNSFSPNGRYLYISSFYNLYQYDTWNPEMATNLIHIATWDTFKFFSIPVLFFMHQLAPDNRIYVSPFNGVPYIGIIDSPDSLGVACNFLQHSLKLPDHEYTNNIPSFPNYDLGPLPGGDTCNSVYTIQLNVQSELPFYKVAPNPVSDWLNIVYSSPKDAMFELYDINGRRVAATSLFYYFKNRLIDVSSLPAGIYFAKVMKGSMEVWSAKIVVQH